MKKIVLCTCLLFILSFGFYFVRVNNKIALIFFAILVFSLGASILVTTLLNPIIRLNFLIWAGIVPVLYNSLGALLTISTINYITWEEYINYDNTTNEDYCNALSIIVIYCSCILFLAIFFNAFLQKFTEVFSQDYPKIRNILLFGLIGIQIYLIISGIVSYAGMSNGQTNGNVPIIYAIFNPLFPVVPFLLARKLRSSFGYIIILLCVFEFFYFLLSGKRMLLNFLLLFFLSYYLKDHFLLFSKKNLLVLIVSIPIYFILSNVFMLYNGIRTFNNKSTLTSGFSISGLVEIYKITSDVDKELIEESFSRYTSIRAILSLQPIAIVSYIQRTGGEHLYGKDLINSLKEALPGNYYVDKNANLTGEVLYQKEYLGKFNHDDLGNSIPLQGYVDFGIVGVLIYAIFTGLLLCLLLWLISLVLSKPYYPIGYFALFLICLNQSESDVTVLFLFLRSILLLIFLFFSVKLTRAIACSTLFSR